MQHQVSDTEHLRNLRFLFCHLIMLNETPQRICIKSVRFSYEKKKMYVHVTYVGEILLTSGK